jgi:hypothetical protein
VWAFQLNSGCLFAELLSLLSVTSPQPRRPLPFLQMRFLQRLTWLRLRWKLRLQQLLLLLVQLQCACGLVSRREHRGAGK